MKIYIDNDACPKMAKEILYKTSKRESIELIFIANSFGRNPSKPLVEYIVVGEGADVADDKIVELINEGDLVITEDIPLADRVIKKGGLVVTSRGEELNENNIGERLGVRDLMDDLRNIGINTVTTPPYKQKDRSQFANTLNRVITKMKKINKRAL
ncbi:MAG: DUF188 domain-containing protein [Candidatus Cloacimonadota bacterium]|nr:MAG: DUF188 domain-containing protein [Candidatus Cloacimonadota bacterium]PIE81766.1 MAG: DUF188 domain-containing protein [Candidatus Delongbacteria bacterium]